MIFSELNAEAQGINGIVDSHRLVVVAKALPFELTI
jgi:hypothetical protein